MQEPSTPRKLVGVACRPAIFLVGLLASCDPNAGGFENPTADTGPVAAIKLSFVNTLGENLYVGWSDDKPAFRLRRGDNSLEPHRMCIPDCGTGCACVSCEASNVVRVVAPGTTLSVSWVPVHYVTNTCEAEGKCSCLETWPLTAGSYDLTLAGTTQMEGGEEVAGQPGMLAGAYLGAMSESCTARVEFALEAEESKATAQFLCQ